MLAISRHLLEIEDLGVLCVQFRVDDPRVDDTRVTSRIERDRPDVGDLVLEQSRLRCNRTGRRRSVRELQDELAVDGVAEIGLDVGGS